MHRKLTLSILAAALTLGGCGVNTPGNNETQYGDGALPVEERQPLEEFISEVEPGIIEFMQELERGGAELWLPKSNESSLESCGYPVYGYSLFGPTLFGRVIPEADIIQLYEKHIKPLGFVHTYHNADEIDIDYRWFNPGDGGYVSVMLHPDGKLITQYVSGCRPYRGAGKPEHVRTAWEQELIARQPTAYPSATETAGR
ncbi:DUF4853 domain-containing protein [Buchananella hordeovulneris]|uniref:DUF4853 domain-containing protein n=1 Tax=Buchananella hordeovulneris TaxID=52770 RepID=UPI000F5DEFAA|nr:DUF4853 domain-containing protein [Buchananella hordeovulneris]RRD51586.1 DUF4853 domain-containing protein [Buchananella hordeovulneris]